MARAQQPGKLPTIGYLGATTTSTQTQMVAAFAGRLHELGWIEGRNLTIEYRYAEGRSERYAELAAEFVRLNVDVIVTYGTPAVVLDMREVEAAARTLGLEVITAEIQRGEDIVPAFEALNGRDPHQYLGAARRLTSGLHPFGRELLTDAPPRPNSRH